MRKIWRWILRNNEFTAVLALIAVIWYAMPPLLRLIDPQAGEFGVEVIYVPLIAGLFFLVGGKRRKGKGQEKKFRVSGFGFRVPGSGFQVSGFWFRVSSSGFRVSSSGFSL